MGSLSIWHWFIVLMFFVGVVFPITKILSRAGYKRWWVIPFLIPGVGLIALWIFAFSRWPALDGQPSRRLMEAAAQLRAAADAIDTLNDR